jgi:repressor of nif and glnA expression
MFEWHEVYGVRSVEFRLRRLEQRGMVKRSITGEWPNIESRWRRVKGKSK